MTNNPVMKPYYEQDGITMNARFQKDPMRDAELTAAFHRMLSVLKPPRKPIDGIKVKDLRVLGWVRMDVRFLK